MCLRHQPEAALRRIEQKFEGPANRAGENWFLTAHCRLNAALGRTAQAEADARAVLRSFDGHPGRMDGTTACLLIGFLRERLGDAAGAQKAWSEGFGIGTGPGGAGDWTKNEDATAIFWQNGFSGAASVMIAGGLAGMPDERLQPVIDAMVAGYGRSSDLTAAQRGIVPVPARVVRGLFQGARGHQWAQRFVFRDEPAPQLVAEALPLAIEQFMRDGSLGESPPTADQAAVFARASVQAADAVRAGRVGKPQLLQLYLAWKGTTGWLGWRGVAPSLQPALRGPLAYVLGSRYLRLGKLDAAHDLFKQALIDASGDAVLRQLATAELGHAADTRPAAAR